MIIALCGMNAANGQGTSGTITGTVSDSSGAAVSGANVSVTNVATAETVKVVTDGSGAYTVPLLRPDKYSVKVEAPGFQTSIVNGLTLVVAQVARVNIALQVGAATDTIEVVGNAVALDTDTSSISQTITNRQVVELPLNGRNFLQLLFIGAGAVQSGGEQGVMRAGAGGAISINGSRPESNNYIIDGMPNTDGALGTPAVILSVDAIQEFKEQTATYPAQYGYSANQVNLSSKSGTNNLHGTVFYFGRNNAMDAQNFFYTPGAAKPVLHQHQFGFVVGGPVYIPKLYDGRDKMFFLANYEGWRINQGVTARYNVPTTAQLSGDFSAYADNPVCVSGAATTNCLPIDPVTGLPFPNNQIPANRFSRLANLALNRNFFPQQNCDPSTCNGRNYQLNPTLPSTTNQQTYRLDRNLGRWGQIYGRGTIAKFSSTSLPTSISQPWGLIAFDEEATNWSASWTAPIKSNLINQFTFGRLIATVLQGSPSFMSDQDVAALGLTGVYTQMSGIQKSYPYIAFNNTNGENLATAFGAAGNAYTSSKQPLWFFSDTVTWTVGKHTMSMGGEYRQWYFARDLASNPYGSFNFSDYFTGNQVADMLLGYYAAASTFQPSALSSQTGNPRQFNLKYFAPYFQDDIKLTPKVTVNLGLRWDYRTIPVEAHNHMGWLDVTNPNGGLCIADKSLISAGVTAPAPGFSTFYRYCGSNRPKNNEKKNFAPRIGFAARPFGDDKTVVRGGYGIFWDSIEGREVDGSADIYPYVIRTNLSQTPGALITDHFTTNQLFVDYSSTVGPAIPGPTGTDSFLAVNISEAPKNPYVQQFTLSLQRELAKNTTIEVNYIGNKGTHLLGRQNINAPTLPSAFCRSNPTLSQCVSTSPSRRPYPYFGSYFINSMWGAYSNYNSANVKFERRTNSMAITSVYTWSKNMDVKSAAAAVGASTGGWQGFTNNYDINYDYGPSDFDVDQRFVTSVIYELPLGRGKKFGGNMGWGLNTLAGGWQVNGIYTAQTGFPMSVFSNDISGLLGISGQRADMISNPNSGFTKTRAEWINKAAFSPAKIGVFGNSGRNYLRMPGINNFDLAAFKTLQFTERASLQLRLESFNTLNHPQFNPDPSTPAFASGGSTVDNNANSSTFGLVTAAAPGRILQLGAKFVF